MGVVLILGKFLIAFLNVSVEVETFGLRAATNGVRRFANLRKRPGIL